MAASLAPREILGAAWPLFKSCLPVCLPLAVVGVAAGATPGAEAAMHAGARSAAYSREWWGVTAASIVLTLICYGAVLRQQLALAQGARLPVLVTLRRAALDIPLVLPALLLLVLPLAPAMLVTAWRGFGAAAAALTLAGAMLLVYGWFAWLEVVARTGRQADTRAQSGHDAGGAVSPLAGLAASIRLVQGRWRAFALVAATLLAAVLVFVLLTGIFIGMVMGLAGQSSPDAGGLAFSRWLMALILAVPVVYGGAVTVSAWRAAAAGAHSPT